MKPKTCKVCKNRFTPIRPLQQVCSHLCASKKAKEDQEKKKQKEWNKEKQKRKNELKTLTDWKKDLEKEINGIARVLDKGATCISCGGNGKEQAGHYHSVGSNDSIRFNLHNIHKQCYHCNVEKSSNIIGYDEGLIDGYGKEYWEYVKFDLVKDHPLVKLSIDQIQEAIGKARMIRKELEKANQVIPPQMRVAMRNKLNNEIGIYANTTKHP